MRKQLVISDWLAGRRSLALGVVRDEGFKECSDLLLLTTREDSSLTPSVRADAGEEFNYPFLTLHGALCLDIISTLLELKTALGAELLVLEAAGKGS